MMTNMEFVSRVEAIATDCKTLYVMGCFGAPLTGSNVDRYCSNHEYNRQTVRTSRIKVKANQDPPVFGFDCVCLIKAILWGWNGDKSKTYGGASYASNGVPDIGADAMIGKCYGVSTDFSKLVPGEAVWMEGISVCMWAVVWLWNARPSGPTVSSTPPATGMSAATTAGIGPSTASCRGSITLRRKLT